MFKNKITGKQLGIYWAEQSLYFVESADGKPSVFFRVPFEQEKISSTSGDLVPWKTDLINHIQETLREKKIVPGTIHLSLPTKDIIFRSFVIPWMQAHEVRGVVDFEIRKYMPFALDELSYNYHSIVVKHNETRSLRIIFVAIKKATLDFYTKILGQSTLTPKAIEAAPFSLMRSLIAKNIVSKDQSLVIVEKEKSLGKITLVNQGIPQFVREFSLALQGTVPEAEIAQTLLTRFLNEIRISLDYFNRHNPQLNIKQLLILSNEEESYAKTLEEYLKLNAIVVKPQAILGNEQNDLDYVYAYGASLVGSDASRHLNLYFDKGPSPGRLEGKFSQRADYLKSIFSTGLLCLLVVLLTFFFLQKQLTIPKQEVKELSQKLGNSKTTSVNDLAAKKDNLKNKLQIFQNTRLRSNINTLLSVIPSLLPEGTWLKTLEIKYLDSVIPSDKIKGKTPTQTPGNNMEMEIIGFSYHVNTSAQFNLVNTFFTNLKQSKEISGYFPNIVLETTKIQKLDDVWVTSFKIKCW